MGLKAVPPARHSPDQTALLLLIALALMVSTFPPTLWSRLSITHNDSRSPILENDTSYDLILKFDPNATPLSPVIPRDFVSLSFEWSYAARLAKSPAFQNLISDLLQHPIQGNSSTFLRRKRVENPKPLGMNLRVGGNSADRSRWDASSHPPRNSMTPEALRALYRVAQSVGGTLTLDLTMQSKQTTRMDIDTTWAVQEWRGILQTLSNHSDFDAIVEAIEIGNEPDLFPDHGYRPSNYSLQDYAREYDAYLHDLKLNNSTNQKIVQGGTFCCHGSFVQSQAALMYVFQGYLKSWSFHKYATTTCRKKTTSIAALLSDASTDAIGRYIRGYAASATALGIPAYMGETNSASCGGQVGVSDTLASALWSIDYLFVLAAHNISRVNFHGGGTGPYTWFVIPETDNSTTTNNKNNNKNNNASESSVVQNDDKVQVRPLYYGMFVWNWLVANQAQSQVFPVECHGGEFCFGNVLGMNTDNYENESEDSIHAADGKIRVKAWAMGDSATGDHKVVIINKLYNSSATKNQSLLRVKLFAPFPKGQTVTLKSLLGEGMEARSNLTFAGWTWEESQAGERSGTYESTRIYPKGNEDNCNTFEILVPPATVVVAWFSDLNHMSMGPRFAL